jgi:5-methylcytosine-specific restriction endonuclease McrA
MEKQTKKRIPWNKNKTGLQVAWNKDTKGVMKPNKTSFQKGQVAPMKGRKRKDIPWNKGLKGLSIGFPKGKHNTKISGENHYCWKGGITPENKIIRRGVEIRLVIADSKERDNYTCQMPECGIRGGKLESHHIKTFIKFPELRRDINNLITLCNKCHNKTKRKEKKYEELFINIIKLKQHE